MRSLVKRFQCFSDDPNAYWRHPRHHFNAECIWVNSEEVRIKGVMMGGAERQPVAPVVRALISLSTDVRSLHEARMGDHTDRALTTVLRQHLKPKALLTRPRLHRGLSRRGSARQCERRILTRRRLVLGRVLTK